MRRRTIGSLALAVALLVPVGTALAQEASPAPSAEATLAPAAQAFVAAFPAEIGGVSLADRVEVTTADSPDVDTGSWPMLQEVLDDLGVGLDAVLIGQATTFTDIFDEGEQGAWIVAIRIPGLDPATGSDLMLDGFTAETDEELVITRIEVAGRAVTRVASAEDPEAAFSIYAGGDTVWMVASPSADVLEEAIAKLP